MRPAGQRQKGDRRTSRVAVHSGRITYRSQQEAAHTHAAPSDGYASRAACDRIGNHAAHKASNRSRRQGQPRQDAGSFEAQTVFAYEVSGQPRDEELKSEPRSEIARKQGEHGGIEQQGLPRHAFPGPRRRRRPQPDHAQLLGVDRPVIGRLVAKPEQAHGAPDQSRHAEDRKGIAPPDEADEGNRNGRSQRAARPGAHPHDAVGAASLIDGEPSGQRAGERRKRARFSRAEHGADDQQHSQPAGHTSEYRKQRPAADDSDQHAALPPTVAQPRRGHLEDAVGDIEDGEYPGKLHLG